jgi:YVTN family beta-propeller protein
VASIRVGIYPSGLAFGGPSGLLYVANSGGTTVTIINATSLKPAGSIACGAAPTALAYDPTSKEMFVADEEAGGPSEPTGGVAVVNVSSNKVVGTVTAGDGPDGVAFDPSNGLVYVANVGSDNVSVINGSTLRVVGSIGVGGWPQAIAYDSASNDIYVANAESDNVSVVSGATERIVRSIPVGGDPDVLAADAVDGELFVLNEESGNVSIIDVSTNLVVGSLYLGGFPYGMAYDPGNGMVYVSDSTSSVIAAFNATTETLEGYISTYEGAGSILSDPSRGYLFVSDDSFDSVLVVALGPTSLVGEYPVYFNETGLPAGSDWFVVFNGTRNGSASSSVAFLIGNGTDYAFTIQGGVGYLVNPTSGVLSVNGSARTVAVVFTVVPSSAFPVWFNETGLSPGTNWSMTLGGNRVASIGPSIAFPEPNGTYPYTVAPVPGYVSSPGSGTVLVAGSSRSQPTFFGAAAPGSYAVAFSESGLTLGTFWSVRLGPITRSSNESVVVLGEPNGSYPFSVSTLPGYAADPSSGTVNVSGSAVNQYIVFTMVLRGSYSVTFEEVGLPTRSVWGVSVDGDIVLTTPNATEVFYELNGTGYPFSVPSPQGFDPDPSHGTFDVRGAPVTVKIVFTAVGGPPGPTLLGLPLLEAYALVGGVLAAIAAAVVRAVLGGRRPRVLVGEPEPPAGAGGRTPPPIS